MLGQGLCDCLNLFVFQVFFVPAGLSEQVAWFSVALQVDASNEFAVVQNRQGVVAEDTLWFGV